MSKFTPRDYSVLVDATATKRLVHVAFSNATKRKTTYITPHVDASRRLAATYLKLNNLVTFTP